MKLGFSMRGDFYKVRKEIYVEHGLLAATYKLLTMGLRGNITSRNKDFLNPHQYSKNKHYVSEAASEFLCFADHASQYNLSN